MVVDEASGGDVITLRVEERGGDTERARRLRRLAKRVGVAEAHLAAVEDSEGRGRDVARRVGVEACGRYAKEA